MGTTHPCRAAGIAAAALLALIAAPPCRGHSSFTWTDQPAPVIRFTITGSADTAVAPHSVTLTADTGTVMATGFILESPDSAEPISILPSQLPWTQTVSNRRVTLRKEAGQPYELSIVKLPTTVPRGYMTDVSDWSLTLNGLGATNSTAVSISALTRSLAPTTAANLNVPPQVSITQPASSPYGVTAGQTVSFQASLDHPDRPVTYLWTLAGGDGAAGTTTASASAVYRGKSPPDFTASVTVTDDLEQTGSASRAIRVTNEPPGDPVVGVTPSSSKPFTGAMRRFTAASTDELSTDPAHAPVYSWTISNGFPAATAGNSVDVVFGPPGPATVSVSATDNIGQTSGPVSLSLEVQPKENLVIPAFAALPGNNAPPVVDGRITEGLPVGGRPDVSWSGGTRVEYADGTTRDLAVQALSAPDPSGNRSLYLSFEVRNDASFDPDDLVILAFRGPGGAASPDTNRDPLPGDVALLVYPLADGTSGENKAPRSVELWRYQGTPGIWVRLWETLDGGVGLAGLEVRSRIPPGSLLSGAWDLELKIPMTDRDAGDAIEWPVLGENFLLYWNVCRIEGGTVAQFRWPREAPELVGILSPGLLRPSDWCGTTTDRNAVGRGVYIASPLDIGVMKDGILGNEIVIGGTNRFEATLRNSSLRVAGEGAFFEGAEAAGVRARFRIAGWGTSYDTATWQEVPAAGGSSNPTTAASIPAPTNSSGHSDFDQPGSRTVAFESAALAVPANNRHQCVYVELEALTNVRIVNKKYYRNMNFVDASRFEDKARLDLAPGRPFPAGPEPDVFLLKVQKTVSDRDLRPSRPVPRPAAPGSEKVSTLVWTAHSFRDTGAGLVIRGKTYKVVQPSGSFGYYVRHKGEVSSWKYELAGVEKLGRDWYRYELPPVKFRSSEGVFLDAEIRPVESRWLAGLRGGFAMPVGLTATDYERGPMASLDLGFRTGEDIWLLGSLGYAGLEGIGATPDARWLNASLALSYSYGLGQNFLIRARAGGGWYREADAAVDAFGAEFGLGAEYGLLRRLDAELAFVYRRIFDAPLTQFVTASAGFIWRF